MTKNQTKKVPLRTTFTRNELVWKKINIYGGATHIFGQFDAINQTDI